MEEESDTETEMLYQSGGEESEDFDDRKINEVLDAYHDTEKNYAHSGKKALYEKFKNKKLVDFALHHDPVHTKFFRRNDKNRKLKIPHFIGRKRQLIQADTAIFDNEAVMKVNIDSRGRSYKNLFLAVDCFTRRVWLYPRYTNTASESASLMVKLLNSIEIQPENVSTDMGSEFKGEFKDLLEERGINFYYAMGIHKGILFLYFLNNRIFYFFIFSCIC